MRKLCAILAGLLLGTFSSRADLIVYSQKIVVTKTGSGAVTRSTTTGWMIMDGQTADVTLVNLYVPRGRFHADVLTNYAIDNISAGLNKDYMVIAIPGSGVGALTGKGLNKTIDVGAPTTTYSVPKTLTVTGSDLLTDGDSFFNEYKGSLVYNRNETEFANSSAFTLAQEVEDLRQYLLGLGYVEE